MHGWKVLAAGLTAALVAGWASAAPLEGEKRQTPAKQTSPARPQIAMTFDDLPAHGPLPIGGDRLVIARTILAALAAHHAPAFGFMNATFGAGDPNAPRVLAAWRSAGLPIGNHTAGHVNLDTVGPNAFLADALRNEPALAAVAGRSDWHWFRYPFLAEGQDLRVRDTVRAGLRARGYRIAAVTMTFGDYAWNDAFARCTARHDPTAIAALETSYLAAARAQAERSRGLAHAALGRDIPYVLLLHLGAFDARMMPRLLDLYARMGFDFTTLPKAEADPFYEGSRDLSQHGPTATLEAIANAKGLPIPANAPLPTADVCA